ncbi:MULTISPECIES: EndoS/ChiA family endoglycosidase [Lacticaseibacillus]|uniref:EndoS/ChiA family endoglycosidase n=1 Tax=Lacticaseibacillus TaxID=2759736 RepID=UPI00063D9935|nr:MULTISPECIES: hypothetical protein [Lacticaseibacillus]KLI75714.1 hypothetical protein AAW28_09485 [Lacticaseibacillus casei]
MKKGFKLRWVGWLIIASGIFLSLMVKPQSVSASAETPQKTFMVYYRAWRDQAMHGVNTTILDPNPQSMLDLPYGIDIINVFSYVPAGQEAKAQPFFDKLKTVYAPEMHRRGAKLVRALDYGRMVDGLIQQYGKHPTASEIDDYVQTLIYELSGQWGLDGIDIDMEQYPDAEKVALSDRIIQTMGQYLGPKAGNGTLLIYDTNGSYLVPFKNVMGYFSNLGYQQYGSGPNRTEKMRQTYTAASFPQDRLLAGLTFPEEGDQNRWYDTDPNHFLRSNMHTVATFSRENLGGMFVYAVDRDGRTYEEPDFSHIRKTTYRWTKTAILETKGYSLNEIKAAAYRHLKKIAPQISPIQYQLLHRQINQTTNAFEVNSVFMKDDFNGAVDPTFDAVKEMQMDM